MAQFDLQPADEEKKFDLQPELDTHQQVIQNMQTSPATTFALKALDTGGFGDEMLGAGQAAAATPGILAQKGISLDALRAIRDKYRASRDEARQAFSAAAEKNPKSAIAGDVANAVGVGMLAGPASKGMSAWQKAQAAARVGAAYGLGHSNADLTRPITAPEEYGKALTDTASAADTAGALANVPARTLLAGAAGTYWAKNDIQNGDYKTAAAKIAIPALAAQALPGMIRTGFSLASGVNPDAVSDYMARSGEINAEQATKSSIKDKLDTLTTGLRDKAAEAQDTLKTASGQKLADTADAVQKGLSDLKKKVVSGSAEAVDTLKNAVDENGVPVTGAISTRGLKQQLTNQIRRLQPLGPEAGAPPGPASASEAQLQAWRSWVDKLPPYLTNEQTKSVIKKIDAASADFYNRPPGSFAPEEATALARVRRGLDVRLKKNVPEYAEAMQPVAKNSQLLNEARSAFPEKGTVSTLRNIGAPQNRNASDVLNRLGQATGNDFGSMLDTSAEQSAADSAQAAANSVRPITPNASGQSGAEPFLNRMMAGKEKAVTPSIDDQNLLETLSQHYPELPNQIQNLKTREAFTGARGNGSRRTLMGTVLGAAADAGLRHAGMGDLSLFPGMWETIGAGAGYASDQYAPQAGKAVLDKAVIPIRDGATAVVKKLQSSPAGQQFVAPLVKAAQSDPVDFASRYFLMSQQYPAFRGALGTDKQ